MVTSDLPEPEGAEPPVAASAEAVTVASAPGQSVGGMARGLLQMGLGSEFVPEADHLEVEGVLDRGGMGVVYRARDTRLGRMVALKVMGNAVFAGEEERRRFRQDAEAAGKLRHPNIVPIFEVGETEGTPWFTMPLYLGGSLARRLGAGPLELREAVGMVAVVARAMQHAHDNGVLHRDLKPANILLDENRNPVVVDFGLAKYLDHQSKHTVTGAVMGTASYMPPEQARGEKLTTAADVYSLGAVLYHLTTGKPPAEGPTMLETLRRVVEEVPVRPSLLTGTMDRDVETICLKCLEKRPGDRYGSAAALAEDLERWLDDRKIAARPSTLREDLWKWARRKPAWAALAGLAVAAVLGFTGVLWLNQGRLRRERDMTEAVRQSAENLLGTAMTDYRRTVEGAVGKLDALEPITESAGAYFDRLPAGLRDERSALLQTRLLTLRGEVAASRGDLPLAAKVLDRALETAGQAAGEGKALVEAAALVARTDVALRQDEPGAGVWAGRAVEAAASAVAEQPGNSAGAYSNPEEAARQLGLARFFEGRSLVKQAKTEEAEGRLVESERLAREVLDSDLEHLQKRREWWWVLVEQAKLAKNRGLGLLADIAAGREGKTPEQQAESKQRAEDLLAKSAEQYGKVKGELGPMVARDPSNYPLRRDLSVVLEGLGDLARKGDPEEALRLYRASLAESQAMVDHDGKNMEWLRELAVSHRSLAEALMQAGQGEEALRHFDLGIAVRRKLLELDPEGRSRRDFCNGLLVRGEARLKAKRPVEAREDFAEAEAMTRESARTERERGWWENRRVGALFRLGVTFVREDPEKTRELLGEAVTAGDALERAGRLEAGAEKSRREAQAVLLKLNVP